MTEDIGIVVQGPNIYYKDICDKYVDFSDIVWSCWEDDDPRNLSYVKNGVVVKNQKPLFNGYGNVNYQCISTISGIDYLKNNTNCKYVLKIRSDMFFSDTKKLLNILKGKVIKSNKLQVCFFDQAVGGYIGDYFSFGATDEQFLYWNYYDIGSTDFAERQLTNNYLKNKGINLENINNYVEYILKYMMENNIGCWWIKNQIDILSYIEHSQYTNFLKELI